MSKFKFALYGVWIGAKKAILGSLIFSILGTPITFLLLSVFQGENLFAGLNFGFFVVGVMWMSLYYIAFSVLPGMIGGAYLAHSMIAEIPDVTKISRRGSWVGALAGFIASAFFLYLFLWAGGFYEIIGIELLALAIAAWMGRAGARSISKRLEISYLQEEHARFSQPDTETPDTETP